MKKNLFIMIIFLLTITCTHVKAQGITLDMFKNYNIQHSYVIGEYIFDLDSGYSPSLQDIMVASRTIPEGETSTIYEYFIIPGIFFQVNEVYSGQSSTNEDDYKIFNASYIYRNNIRKATERDYTVID